MNDSVGAPEVSASLDEVRRRLVGGSCDDGHRLDDRVFRVPVRFVHN